MEPAGGGTGDKSQEKGENLFFVREDGGGLTARHGSISEGPVPSSLRCVLLYARAASWAKGDHVVGNNGRRDGNPEVSIIICNFSRVIPQH